VQTNVCCRSARIWPLETHGIASRPRCDPGVEPSRICCICIIRIICCLCVIQALPVQNPVRLQTNISFFSLQSVYFPSHISYICFRRYLTSILPRNTLSLPSQGFLVRFFPSRKTKKRPRLTLLSCQGKLVSSIKSGIQRVGGLSSASLLSLNAGLSFAPSRSHLNSLNCIL
jgi:hypothetical protein